MRFADTPELTASRYKQIHPRYIERHSVMHPLYFSCVRPEARRQGIMTQMWNKSVEVASDFHFDHVVTEASSEITGQVCTKLGFKEVW